MPCSGFGRDDRPPRYLVVDYKTNWLGGFDGEILTVGDYAPARMAEAMMGAHYPLQALLYAVAVHRMLRWRQPELRSGCPFGRSSLSFRTRNGWPGNPAGRWRAVRCVQLAPAIRARRRALRAAGRSAHHE